MKHKLKALLLTLISVSGVLLPGIPAQANQPIPLDTILYARYDNYKSALETSYDHLKNVGGQNKPIETARVNYKFADMLYVQQDFEEAINHYKSALQFFREADDWVGIASSYDAIAASYGALNDTHLNLYYDSLALSIVDTLDAPFTEANILLNYGRLYRKTGNYRAARSVVNKALSISKKINNHYIKANAYNELGALDELDNEPTRAHYFYKKSNKIATYLNDIPLLIKTCESLYQFHARQNEYESAFEFLHKVSALNNSLQLEEKSKQFQNYKLDYESNQELAELIHLKAIGKENEIMIQKQKGQTLTLFLTALLSVFLAILLYNSYKSKNQYNKRLEAEVKARTSDLKIVNQDLQIANKKLKQSNLELERFAYIASHDLKSPLRNIVSFLGLSQRKIKHKKYNEIEEYLRFASDNAKQMYSLIQDVLEFSRVNNQLMTGWEKEVNLNEVLANVIYNIDSDIKLKNAEVLTCPLPVVKGSKVHLMQLFQNLISNGIKYNENQMPVVQLSHEENLNEHIICIKDNGIGIEQQYQDKVFDMFKRLHTQNQYSGTGLGLSICKKVIQDMKGKIWLESIPGEGTTFYISIPKMPVPVMADQN